MQLFHAVNVNRLQSKYKEHNINYSNFLIVSEYHAFYKLLIVLLEDVEATGDSDSFYAITIKTWCRLINNRIYWHNAATCGLNRCILSRLIQLHQWFLPSRRNKVKTTMNSIINNISSVESWLIFEISIELIVDIIQNWFITRRNFTMSVGENVCTDYYPCDQL